MFRIGERNNGGILLAWSFYLSQEILPAIFTLVILNIFLWRELHINRRLFLANIMFLGPLYMLIGISNSFVREFSFLLLLAVNLSLYLPLLMKGRVLFKDAALWLLAGLLFYVLALVIPSAYFAEFDRMRAFAVIAILFLPYSFAYVLTELFYRKKYSTYANFIVKNVVNYK